MWRTLTHALLLKQFNLLSPNTLLWSHFIYYPLTHQFEAITLGWIKTCVKWFWDNFDWDWQTETWVINKFITYSTPKLLNSRAALYFPCDLNHPLKFDWQTGRQERQAYQKTSMLVVVTPLKRLIYNINYYKLCIWT